MERVLSLAFILAIQASVWAQTLNVGTPFIRNYAPEEFNGGIQSWDFIENEDEILYVANNFGLLEYDGATWKLFPVKNGTKVRAVHVGGDGQIFVGSQADFGYFLPDDVGTLRYYSLADSLSSENRNFDEVWRIYENSEGTFFFTFKNIFRYRPGEPIEVIRPNSPLQFSFQINSEFYTIQAGIGLSALQGNNLRLVPGGEYFANLQVVAILPYSRIGLLIFTARQGIFIYDGATVLPFEPKTPLVKNAVINNAILLSDGSFAVGTQNDGLIIIDRSGHVQMHIDRTNGLIDQTVHSLYQDSHDNLWLGLNNSISMVELSSPFSLIDGNVGLSGTGYAARRVGDILYLGTNTGLYRLNTTAGEKTVSLVPNSGGQVYQLKTLRDRLLMGHHNGPYEIRGGMAHEICQEPGVWDFIPFPDRPDYILMGSYTGLSLLKASSEGIERIRRFEGFDESSRVMEFDEAGNVWMAHGYKGIYRITFDSALDRISSIRFYNSRDGLPADHLNNMELVDNRLIFPALYGIYTYDRSLDRFLPDERYQSLFGPGEHIIKMDQDVLGNIYFISRPRVGRASFDKFGKATVEVQQFNKIRDLLNDDLGFVHAIDPVNVIFGAKRGFILYNASRPKELKPFKTHLRQVVSTSFERDSLLCESSGIKDRHNDLALSYAMNSIRFVYASSFYENPEKTEYQYLLENFDQGWSAWTSKTEKEYTNLPEGQYTFRVRARNVYAIESESTPFTFTVHPPFYRSRLAYFLYVTTGLLVLSLAAFQIRKRFRHEKRRLIIKQERELQKKNTEIRQITTQREKEVIQLRNEKLQSEVEHMNRELTSSTIHLINKNALLSTVKTNLEHLMKKNGEAPYDELRRIIHNIDNNLSSDGDWKQFELHFNNVHGNFTHRLLQEYPKLTPQEVKLSAYLRLNLTTKEIAHLLNISVRGVEISRYRLRKKLGLDRNENLTDFMLRF